MGKFKDQPRYNVVSIRVSDEEKELLEKMTRKDRTSLSSLLREALLSYLLLKLDTQRLGNNGIMS
jgi:predicted transcriptional regulator